MSNPMWEDFLKWFREADPEILAGPQHIRMRAFGGSEACVYDFICENAVFTHGGKPCHATPFRHFGANRIRKHLKR